MWYHDVKPRNPFYRRKWFIILCVLVLVPLLVGCIYALVVIREYQAKAREFDPQKLQEMESASLIFDRNGNVLGRIFIQNRDTVAIESLPPEVARAVVAAEDARFFKHHGVDYYGMFRAALKNYRSGRIREGASTLTQQLARNTYELRERTYKRKLLEIFLALEIEKRFSKNQILEMYLNRVYFGAGFYGIEAASRGYFGKSARELSLIEAATLAGLLRSPNNLSPWSNRQKCIEARDFVLNRMLELGFIDQKRYDASIKETLMVKNRRPLVSDSYAVDLVRQQVIDLVGYEDAAGEGYRIYTTIDAQIQKEAEQSVEKHLREVENRKDYDHQTFAEYQTIYQKAAKSTDGTPPPAPAYLQGAVVAMDNETGGILALVGGRNFRHSEYNRAVSAARPAGTGFIPFVYAAAYEKGIFPGTLVEDAAMDNRQVMIGGTTGILGEWGPERVDNRYEGMIPARQALVQSKNAATVRLGMQTGLDRVIALAKKAGFSTPMRPFPATYLGSSEVTLLDMVEAYTIFPNAGRRPAKPLLISKVETKGGKVIFSSRPSDVRVISPETAYEVHSALSEVLERGTADKAFTDYRLRKLPLGGKTGTAYGFTDAWFVGYSSEITCGVWVGFDKPQTIYRGAFSNEVALPIWVDIMNDSFERYRPRDIQRPPGMERYQICSSSGLLATDKCFETYTNPETGAEVQRKTTYFEYASPKQAPKDTCDVHGESTRSFVRDIASGEWPRARPAVDLAALEPVEMKAPTVIGPEDPYKAVTVLSTDGAQANPFGDGDGAPGEEKPMEVRRAEPVRALDKPEEISTIQLEPPPPLEF